MVTSHQEASEGVPLPSGTRHWRECVLSELCDIKRGASPRPIHEWISFEGIPWIKIADATSSPYRTISQTDERILQSGKEKSVAVVPGDLILSNSATPGIPKFVGMDACIHDGWLLLRNFRGLDPMFCYYLLLFERPRIVGQGTGSVFTNLKIDILEKYTVRVPGLSEQRAIAHILSTLDDKIELNRNMDETLKAMAQAIFKDWFVYFGPVRAKRNRAEPYFKSEIWDLFPDSFTADGLPQTWRYSHLSEIASVTKGKSYRSVDLVDSDVALVTLKSFVRGGGYRSEGLKPYRGEYKPEQKLDEGDLIVAYTDVTQSADVIGVPALVPNEEYYDELVASLDVGIVRSQTQDVSNVFLYNLFLCEHFRSHVIAYCTGTTVLHLDKRALPSYPVMLPSSDLLAVFNKIAEPMRLRQNRLLDDSKALERVRDTLLPKLISGEIRVKDAEKIVESVT